MALKAADIKPGMAVVCNLSGDSAGQWELLDKHPNRGWWWLHRWTRDGEWETTSEHQDYLHRVADGSRHEHIQTELEIAA